MFQQQIEFIKSQERKFITLNISHQPDHQEIDTVEAKLWKEDRLHSVKMVDQQEEEFSIKEVIVLERNKLQ